MSDIDDRLPGHARKKRPTGEWTDWSPDVTISSDYRYRLGIANGYLEDRKLGFSHEQALKRTGHSDSEAILILRWMGVLSGEIETNF